MSSVNVNTFILEPKQGLEKVKKNDGNYYQCVTY